MDRLISSKNLNAKRFQTVGNYFLIACLAFFINGCGGSRGVPSFGRQYASGAPSSTTASSWSSVGALDNVNGGISNFDTLGGCSTVKAGFTGTGADGGCVQQPSIAEAGGRWFVGFPQRLPQSITGGTSYYTTNPDRKSVV